MGSTTRAAIVGVAESDLGYTPDKTVLQLQHQAARAALDDAGLTFKDVEALFCAGNWAWAPTLMLAEYLGLQPKYTDGTNIGGSSFEAHLGHAVAGIEAGLFDVALITYGSTQRSDRRSTYLDCGERQGHEVSQVLISRCSATLSPESARWLWHLGQP